MIHSFLALTLFTVSLATAGVVGKEVTYTADSLTLKGYIAYNDTVQGKHPGVLVVHEWWGNNDYSRKRADMLAGLGYVALAVDMYGNGQQADNPTDAGKLAGDVMKNMPAAKARFVAAMEFLKNDSRVDPNQIGAIGYCFGGGVVLAMAREGLDLKAVVSFHGSLASQRPAEKGAVKAKILVCNGGADRFTPSDAISQFKSEMKSAGADFKCITYPGALHAFTNPAATALGKKFNIPIAYNASADKKSWSEMKKWFARAFK